MPARVRFIGNVTQSFDILFCQISRSAVLRGLCVQVGSGLNPSIWIPDSAVLRGLCVQVGSGWTPSAWIPDCGWFYPYQIYPLSDPEFFRKYRLKSLIDWARLIVNRWLFQIELFELLLQILFVIVWLDIRFYRAELDISDIYWELIDWASMLDNSARLG